MSRRAVAIDCFLAVVLAAIALALTGLGVVALIAIVVLLLAAATFAGELVTRRRRGPARRRDR